jgi:hypothetical protein
MTLAAAFAVVGAGAVSLQASSPKFFQASTQSDFLKGDVENLSIDNRGQLVIGPANELVYETAAPFLWSLLPAADGSLLVGSGNEGQVFRVDAQGNGSRIFSANELEVHALAAGPNGAVYAATSPDGKIYKVERNGAATTFFDPEDKYIWALATDPGGNVYAATGQKGGVYKITPDGKGSLFYESKSTHVTALALDKAGNLLVGTESPGRVLRVGSDGKAFLLLDSPFQEIRALHFDDKGMLYVAAVSGTSSGGASPAPPIDSGSDRQTADASRAPIPVVTTEVTSIAIVDTSGGGSSSGASSTPQERGPAKGAIYRIAPDVGVARGLALRSRARQSGTIGAGHRQQRKNLSARGGTTSGDAHRPRPGRPGHRALQGRQRSALLHDRQSWKALPPERRPRCPGHVRVGTT